MNKQEAKEYIDQLPDNSEIALVISLKSSQVDPPTPPDPSTTPATRLIEIEESEAFKVIDYYNEAGKPVMKSAQVGWKTKISERYLVYVDFIEGDQSVNYWRIWIGEEENISTRDKYITKRKTKIIK